MSLAGVVIRVTKYMPETWIGVVNGEICAGSVWAVLDHIDRIERRRMDALAAFAPDLYEALGGWPGPVRAVDGR